MTTTCANIGPRQRRQRVAFGVLCLGLGVLVAGVLIALGVARPWRVAVFPLFWAGAIGVFQAKEQTCIALAAKGLRDMDEGEEPVSDPPVLQQIQAQVRKVHAESFVTAVLATGAALLVPV